jgi:hypothetical protein
MTSKELIRLDLETSENFQQIQHLEAVQVLDDIKTTISSRFIAIEDDIQWAASEDLNKTYILIKTQPEVEICAIGFESTPIAHRIKSLLRPADYLYIKEKTLPIIRLLNKDNCELV